jgi:hypothetical protein
MNFFPYFIDGELYWKVQDILNGERVEITFDDGVYYIDPMIGDWMNPRIDTKDYLDNL